MPNANKIQLHIRAVVYKRFPFQVPKIVDLERKAISSISKQANMLIERRRQDVRDQAKEITQAGSE